MKKATPKKRPHAKKSHSHGREISGVFLLALGLLTTLALATYRSGNLLRSFGEGLSTFLIQPTFGHGPSFVFPFLFFLWGTSVLLRWKTGRTVLISMVALWLAFWVAFILYLLQAPGAMAETCGLLGLWFGDWICGFMGPLGAWIVWILLTLTTAILLLRFRPSWVLEKSIAGGKAGSKWAANKIRPALHRPTFSGWRKFWPFHSRKLAGSETEPFTLEEPLEEPVTEGELLPEQESPDLETPIQIASRGETLSLPFKPELKASRQPGEYHLPPLSLLADPPPESPDAPEELRAKAKRLQEALSDFGVGAKVVKVNPGPVITRFDLEPDPGVKVSRISALADDLALVLRARAIRIQAPIPGQGAVGVEIPNRQPSIVALKSVVCSSAFQDHPSPLAIALGETASGEPYVSDLGRMPHLLLAGTTGSGKSVCLNTIIASLLLRNPPQRLQFVIIDPKKLEMSGYARLARHHLLVSPQLDEEVITTPANAVAALGGVEYEMGRRYDVLAGAGVRNIEEFNALAAKGEAVSLEGELLPPLSYLVVVIDELADLMMISAKDIEDPIARLAQMARAVGIHLIVATQRPSVDVITGIIKANFPARLAFQVASKVDSRTILDANGADTLLGNGDALFIPPGRGQPERIHCCYVSTSEIEAIVEHIENQPNDFYRAPFIIPRPEGLVAGDGGESSGEVDEFFEEAARIVIHQGQASVSVLQRRLKIGYARAGRLIDQLERAGVVGPFDGSKAREVLVDEKYLTSRNGDHSSLTDE